MGCGYLQKKAHTLNVRSPIRGVLLQFQFAGRMGHNPGSQVSDRGPLRRAETCFGFGCTNAIGWHPGDWHSTTAGWNRRPHGRPRLSHRDLRAQFRFGLNLESVFDGPLFLIVHSRLATAVAPPE